MKCPMESGHNRDLLLSHAAGKLDAESSAAVERHARSCAACGEFVDGQAALWSALDEWKARPVASDFDRRLYRRIEDQEQRSWWSRWFAPLWRPAVPVAATACLLVVAGLIGIGPDRVAPPAAVAESGQAGEVELVEGALEDLEMLRQFDLAPAGEEASRLM
jgi:anti-sigma factor RsiW